jgi:hypothetical protein
MPSALIARAAVLAAILALGASSALASDSYLRDARSTTQYLHAPRSPALPGYVVVRSVSSTQVRVSGLPVDEFEIPFAAHSGSGVALGLPSAALFAIKQMCSRRRTRCDQQGFGPSRQWFPVSARFLVPGDIAIATLDASVQEAATDYRSGRPVPAALLVDISPAQHQRVP